MSNNQTISGMVPINGAELYYEVRGEGHPLLLLHAGVADSRMWDDQFEVLAQTYRVIRFDLRGFGRSTMPSGRFAHYEDVRQLLHHLDVQAVYVVGISFGGLIALDFTLAYPDLVQALILGAPSVSGDTPSERVRQFWEAEDAALEAGDLTTAVELNLRLWVDGPHRTPDQVDATVRQRVGVMQLDAFQKSIPDDVEERPLDPPAIARLATVNVPTLIIVGDLDLEEKLTLVDRLVAAMPQASKAVLEQAAHMMNMERPERFNQFVLDFLAGV